MIRDCDFKPGRLSAEPFRKQSEMRVQIDEPAGVKQVSKCGEMYRNVSATDLGLASVLLRLST